MSTPNTKQYVAITQPEAQKVSELYARYVYLRNATIASPNDEAERQGIEAALQKFFLEHASEFLGCWHAVRTEYEPLLGLFAQVTNRVVGIRAMQQAQAAQGLQQAQDAPADENKIIPITR